MACRAAEIEATPREWFEQPRPPLEFYHQAKMANFGLPGHVFFEKRVGGEDVQYIFDAFTAGEFARIVSQSDPCKVALVKGKFPDFFLGFDDPAKGTMEFEAVEADEKGRRRTDEFKALHEMQLRHGPGYMELKQYSPDEEVDRAREAIPRVVGQKASKGYPVTTNLVVRNNLGALEADEYRNLTKRWQACFNEIWVLKGPYAFQAWPQLVVLGDPSTWVPNT